MNSLEGLTISQEEYRLVLDQAKELISLFPVKTGKAKKAKVKGDNPVLIEGDDLYHPTPWSDRWNDSLECWCAFEKEKQLHVTCHKKINKRLAIIVSTAFPLSVYTRTGSVGYGVSDLNISTY